MAEDKPRVSRRNRKRLVRSGVAGIRDKWSPGAVYSSAMPAKKKPDDRERFKAGDKIRVNLHHGKIEEATVRFYRIDKRGLRWMVDFGNDQTALIEPWQIVED